MNSLTSDEPKEAQIACNREVRLIPKTWQHPKDERGRYVPLLEEQMPAVAGPAPHDTEIAAYETTTEGTPISPVFPDTDEGRLALVRHCAQHGTTFGRAKADAEAWAAILFGEGAAVTLGGTTVAS